MDRRSGWLTLIVVLGLCSLLWAQEAGGSSPSKGGTPTRDHDRRVLVVSIDGMRPDVMLRANTPVMRRLMHEGSFTMWARTTAVAITLPSHVSMLTGVTPARHGVTWNRNVPADKLKYPAFPTLFEQAKKAGYTTAMVAGKSKFAALNKPGTIDWVFLPEKTRTSDKRVGDRAIALIREHQPQVLFVHFPQNDSAGHKYGWGSHEQLKAMAYADRQLGRILSELKAEHLLARTLVIVTSDHGGQGRSHGRNDARSRYIPWIAAGPGVRADYDLTLDASLNVNTEDTFATACWYLDVPYRKDIDGKPITQIMAGAGAGAGAGVRGGAGAGDN